MEKIILHFLNSKEEKEKLETEQKPMIKKVLLKFIKINFYMKEKTETILIIKKNIVLPNMILALRIISHAAI